MNIQISKSNKTAVVFGATGLVGSKLTEQLLMHPSYEKVVVFSRRELKISDPKLECKIVNFDNLQACGNQIKGDDIFLCLGTTQAKAKSNEQFYKVDFTYNFTAAKLAAINKVGQLLLVSSVGANENSFFYYSKVKGKLENAVRKLPFWSIHIFRPSILLGERNENRFGESAAKKIGAFFDSFTGNLLSKYKPVEADIVAKSMIAAAQGVSKGIHVHNSLELQKISEKTDRYLQ